MASDLWRIVRHPLEFFATFKSEPRSANVAYLGYFFLSILSGVTTAAGLDQPFDPGKVIGQIIVGAALFGAAFYALFYGVVWLGVGTKILKGDTDIPTTVKAVGYAVLVPSVLGLTTVPFLLGPSSQSADAPLLPMLIGLSLSLVFGIWILVLMVVAAKGLNQFGWIRSMVATFWFMGMIMATGIVFGVARLVLANP